MIKNELFEECLAEVDPQVRQEVRRNMERQKTYWLIDSNGAIWESNDRGYPTDDMCYEIGNYFATRSQAEEMAKKLKAVLKGAEVIEMPSEENMQTLETKDLVLAEFLKESYKDLDIIMHGRHAYWKGWNAAIRWLKSKIVK